MEREPNDPRDFGGVCPECPPTYLLPRILACISAERGHGISLRKAFCSALACGISLAALAAVALPFAHALADSGALKLLSLIGSDPQTMLANWSDFLLFFLESFPALYLSGFLLAFLGALLSANYLAAFARRAEFFSPAHRPS